MREFEKYEMIKAKCPVCGCKNKVHTDLLDIDGKFKGYSLKCCGCGNYNEFLLNYEDNGKESKPICRKGKQTCVQPSFCPRKDCKLYGTFRKRLRDKNNEGNSNKNQVPDKQLCNENKLSIEVYNQPKFL